MLNRGECISDGIILLVGVGIAGISVVNMLSDRYPTGLKILGVDVSKKYGIFYPEENTIFLGESAVRSRDGRNVYELTPDEVAAVDFAINYADMVIIATDISDWMNQSIVPVIARLAQEQHIVSVSVLAIASLYWNEAYMKHTNIAINETLKFTDAIHVIPGEYIQAKAEHCLTCGERDALGAFAVSKVIQGCYYRSEPDPFSDYWLTHPELHALSFR